jgi:hypothetical protein
MKVEMLTFCYAASVGGCGELNILGATDQLLSAQEPFRVEHCAIVAKIRFDKSEEGIKFLKFTFIDSDGKPIVPIPNPQPANLQIPPQATTATIGTVLNIVPLQIPRFGDYQIDLAVNDTWVASIPLFARKIALPPHMMWPPQPPPPQSA